jgi:hypothetical protein
MPAGSKRKVTLAFERRERSAGGSPKGEKTSRHWPRTGPPRPPSKHGGGGSAITGNIPLGPLIAICCDSVAIRAVSSHCRLKSLPSEKAALAFEPQRNRRAGSLKGEKRSRPGPGMGPHQDQARERGPRVHVQCSVWRSTRSGLTLGTQATLDGTEGFDPVHAFPVGQERAVSA